MFTFLVQGLFEFRVFWGQKRLTINPLHNLLYVRYATSIFEKPSNEPKWFDSWINRIRYAIGSLVYVTSSRKGHLRTCSKYVIQSLKYNNFSFKHKSEGRTAWPCLSEHYRRPWAPRLGVSYGDGIVCTVPITLYESYSMIQKIWK